MGSRSRCSPKITIDTNSKQQLGDHNRAYCLDTTIATKRLAGVNARSRDSAACCPR